MPELILALDPSTDVTGVAILALHEDGLSSEAQPDILLLSYTALDAFALTGQPKSRTGLVDRLERIAKTRSALSAWLGTQCEQWGEINHVAYETQSGRGHASSEALVMAVGAYLTLSRLARVPLIEVNRSSACAAVGASKVYAQPAGATSAQREVKRAHLKQAVICGVNVRLGLTLQPEQDAEADAIAVGLVGAMKVAAAMKAAQAKAQAKKGRAKK